MKFGPRPERPFGPAQPPAIMREYAEMLRAHAREAQELADRLRREADDLDRLAESSVRSRDGTAGDGSRTARD